MPTILTIGNGSQQNSQPTCWLNRRPQWQAVGQMYLMSLLQARQSCSLHDDGLLRVRWEQQSVPMVHHVALVAEMIKGRSKGKTVVTLDVTYPRIENSPFSGMPLTTKRVYILEEGHLVPISDETSDHSTRIWALMGAESAPFGQEYKKSHVIGVPLPIAEAATRFSVFPDRTVVLDARNIVPEQSSQANPTHDPFGLPFG